MSHLPRRGSAVVGPRVPAKPRQATLWDRAVSPHHDLVDEATLRQIEFADVDLTGQAGDSVEFVQCRFTRATLAGVVLDRAALSDCTVDNSDWANLRATKSSLLRVEVGTSRLTGFHWIDGALRDVVFRDCRMDLATLRFTTFKNVAFVGCNLTRADFTNADLRGANFVDCDLTAAQFAQVNAAGARFTRCDLAAVGSVAGLHGAVLSGQDLAALARALAGALGIIIESD